MAKHVVQPSGNKNVSNRSFPKPREALPELKRDSSFLEFTTYYMKRAGLTENQLENYSRIDQRRLNKIAHAETEILQNVPVSDLVSICLVLGLSVAESRGYLARRDRSFNPSKAEHTAYLEIIRIYYAEKVSWTCFQENPERFLDRANAILRQKGFGRIP